MERGICQVNYSHVSEDGTFQGYASVFGKPNVLNMVIERGAFANTIGKRIVRMLFDHDDAQPIGRWLEINEDLIGLWVRGQLDLKVARALEIKSLMQTGAIDGMSISFDVLKSTTAPTGTTHVSEVDLWEISIVVFPGDEQAHVDSVQMFDTLALDAESIRHTKDGYLTAFARAARSGIQVYKGRDLGRPDMGDVRVYRPEAEVFHPESLKSYGHRPMTNDHPPVPVSSQNWKRYAVGQTSDPVVRDGEFVRVPMVLMDAAAIQDVKDGKRELSLGYSTEIKWGSGRTPTGESYDATQTAIRANHLAIVTAARGGSNLRIGDGENGEHPMAPLKQFTVDGIQVEATDVSAAVITRALANADTHIVNLKKKIEEEEEEKKKLKSASDSAVADHAKAIVVKDAEIATLQKQLKDTEITPAKLDSLVKDRAGVVDKAKTVLGDKLVIDGKTVIEIQRQVVDAVMGDGSKGWSDVEVAAGFRMVSASAAAPTTHDGGGSRVLVDALNNRKQVQDNLDKVYADRNTALSGAWKSGKTA